MRGSASCLLIGCAAALPPEMQSPARLSLDGPSALRAARPFTVFFHIHKCGGSSMCRLAHDNGEVEPGGGNCNFVGSAFQYGCNKSSSAKRTVEEQLALIDDEAAKGCTFAANECNAPHALATSAAVHYVTSIREPLERSASAFYFSKLDQQLGLQFGEWVEQQLRDGPAMSIDSNYRPNYLTRYLSGASESEEIRRPHLVAAKAFAGRLDLIIDVDFLPESMPVLESELGWTATAAPASENESGGGARIVQLSNVTYAKLVAANWADLELHKHMAALAKAQRDAHALQIQMRTTRGLRRTQKIENQDSQQGRDHFVGDRVRLTIAGS